MILGAVNEAYEAVISLTVQGPSGQTREVEAVIDTGFTGFLSLPSALVTELGLPFLTNETAMLADGSLVRFSVHDAMALWDGQPRRVYAHLSDATPSDRNADAGQSQPEHGGCGRRPSCH